ncbi:sialidase family protein [Gilvimarinus sp. SDUM040013]|uniref:Sialidase family protein n=1 Tax=Gilvimarinus gilvus TaxID=3058038 RepID=A0ABU4RXI3_9GAMM|nr:sialidase family protein [Gilvimarinus sp. SDUM040013]MDO3388730.1 sialidase family protein [Gilvimarinus sp. SDUM040013]MDX6849625.1 sialidase family protein [Gilvimarinus sp. SDUM040013]
MLQQITLTLRSALLVLAVPALAQQAPIAAAPDLLDTEQAENFGLKQATGTQTHTVFSASDSSYQYNHGAVPFAFNGKLYVQWQSSKHDEDAPETEVRYAMSVDGRQWSDAIILEKPRPDATVTSGGWWAFGDTLVAYINVWPHDLEPKGGFVEYRTSKDGIHWTAPKPVLNNAGEPLAGIIEQDMRALADGRLLTAVHQQPGLIVKPYFTDDATGLSGWQSGDMTNLPHRDNVSRELEPSWFSRGEELVMVFRDQDSSFRVLAATSHDRGESWTTPMVSNMPDSRAKQSAGNLPNGAAYLVNNPSGSKQRFPLVLSISTDGRRFDQAWLLRPGGHQVPAQKYDGRYKRIGYSYPKSTVFEGYLYVAYATGKEDIQVTRVPLKSLK